MRRADSGRSHFFAEITHLREIVDLLDGERRLLFLLDKVLGGSNSHDPRIGAEALVRHLVQHGAIGLVTAHDLTLAQLAEALPRKLATCTSRTR
jgi:DNA mismatch repair ATPase MutS